MPSCLSSPTSDVTSGFEELSHQCRCKLLVYTFFRAPSPTLHVPTHSHSVDENDKEAMAMPKLQYSWKTVWCLFYMQTETCGRKRAQNVAPCMRHLTQDSVWHFESYLLPPRMPVDHSVLASFLVSTRFSSQNTCLLPSWTSGRVSARPDQDLASHHLLCKAPQQSPSKSNM